MKKNNTSQIQSVRRYFDSIASTYATRYDKKEGYHSYFFQERIHAATAGIVFTGKSVLDIGAGTGGLYDFLVKNHIDFEYLGIDVSAEMLRQSNIPNEFQFHGEAPNFEFGEKKFDYIFMLGLTTYLTEQQLKAHVLLCNQILSKDGKLIVSFTNGSSLDAAVRGILDPVVRRFSAGKKVMQQAFSKMQFSKSKAIKAFQPCFRMEYVYWQNQTITPLNQIMPSFSIFIAKLIKRYMPSFLLPVCSSDFLMVYSRENTL